MEVELVKYRPKQPWKQVNMKIVFNIWNNYLHET